jgi:NADH-quinone oxidoreductase subunit G
MIKLEIDGKAVEVENGSTVMEAANKVGSFIPHFCYHKKLSIAANCRMCLVQVEKAPKPLPACATPATEGMKVQTASQYAKTAQQGVMEFLLINHPLDCPICDQGGECQLQDLAVGYGGSASRYQEEKRVVVNKNLGPLISTDMTRCIHCTRCVRFGQEVAGVMELGMAGRGEHSEILSFVGRTVDSELSGNVIDLCPVGALTSKPFRYSARSWELSRRKSVSPHDGLGSNLIVQVKQDRVMRVLPRENDTVNECWLSDKDRFAYEGLNSAERLTKPMLKQDGKWNEVEWSVALDYVAHAIANIRNEHGADAIGTLASPHQTLEELHLLNKLVRGIGSNNIDTRLRQLDTRADGQNKGARWLGMKVADLAALQSVLVVGSTLRKDHPLLANRLRQASKRGQQINVLHVADDELLMNVANRLIVKPSQLADALAQVAKALATLKSQPLSKSVADATANIRVGEVAQAIAKSLAEKEKTGIFLGNFAEHHPEFSTLHALAQEIARLSGGTLGFLGEAANSVGAAVIGAQPGAQGMCAQGMKSKPRKAYLVFGAEPDMDAADGEGTLAALYTAETVIAFSAFKHAASRYADVLLPIAPFSETAGSFVNTEGTVQSFNGVVKPQGDARPGWKVLRVLGNLMKLNGFEFNSIEDVRADIAADLQAFVGGKLNNAIGDVPLNLATAAAGIERIAEVPLYAADPLVRRAPSLQNTADARRASTAGLAADVFDSLKLVEGQSVRVKAGSAEVILHARRDTTLPAGTVRVALALQETLALGAAADLTVESKPVAVTIGHAAE